MAAAKSDPGSPSLALNADATKRTLFSVSVRDLVTFVLRSGDLGGNGHFAGANRALEGTRGHQRLQKKRPPGYSAEVVVTRTIETEGFALELKGRIDGVLEDHDQLLIEEIKTVTGPWAGEVDLLHLAQAKVYAFLRASETGRERVTVQVTYLQLETDETVEHREVFALADLQLFFDGVMEEYLGWLARQHEWNQRRNASISELAFPFSAYRPGQRALAVAVYRTLRDEGRLFAEAPTGIGKTVSALFPAVKAMGHGEVEKIFYLTAKTVGRTVAEKAVADMRGAGLRLRTVTLTAKDKICFNNGVPCDMSRCPYSKGYYDRIKAALREALEGDSFTRPEIEHQARKHQVCPFELSLDIALWADAVICDFNYVFDPSVSLKRFFGEERHAYAILVDEAHNLADRAREMFSAEIETPALSEVKNRIEGALPGCARLLGKIRRKIASLPKKEEGWVLRGETFVHRKAPESLEKLLKDFQVEAETWLARNEPAEFRPELLEIYFRVLAFRRVLEQFDERYVSLLDAAGERLRLYCVDPSKMLREALRGNGAAIFFSATLRPVEYVRETLGGEDSDAVLQLHSPFDPDHLCVLVHDRIGTTWRARAGSYESVAQAIAATVSGRRGNYLVYFPSFDYLKQVLQQFRTIVPGCRTLEQVSGMSEAERESFIAAFQSGGSETLVGFAVMGGIFGEGIDLVGERLIGVVIVGVGLPQICVERDLLREFCDGRGRPGFEYAYSYPGMSRVLQAAGRLIRSEKDRGVILLMDERFRMPVYRNLLPGWWQPRAVRGAGQIQEAVKEFWDGERT